MKLPKGYEPPEGSEVRGVKIPEDAVIRGINLEVLTGSQLEKPPEDGGSGPIPFDSFTGQSKRFKNIRTVIDGITFDSRREARHYLTLKTLERTGHVKGLRCHPLYRLEVNGIVVARYRPDFDYYLEGVFTVDDVKSKWTITSVYRLKRRLMFAIHGITVREIV